jgi:hypothetical protein
MRVKRSYRPKCPKDILPFFRLHSEYKKHQCGEESECVHLRGQFCKYKDDMSFTKGS